MYAVQVTRPDVAFAVGFRFKFNNNPIKIHWIVVNRVLRYLKGTKYFQLEFERSDSPMVGYSDTDWAGDINDRKYTIGYVFKFQEGSV